MRDRHWRDRAGCAGVSPNTFYPEVDTRGANPEVRKRLQRLAELEAKAICLTCPVKDDCLTHALRYDEEGIWGATTSDERRELRRRP